MKCASIGSSIIDNVIQKDGTSRRGICGGMAVYGYTGIKLYTDDVMLFTGIGDDYYDYYGEWIERNHVAREGLIRRHEHTMNIELRYDGDRGVYYTRSIYGDDEQREEHQRQLDLDGSELEPYCRDLRWLYVGWNWLDKHPGLLPLKKKYGFRVLYEVESRISPSHLPVFERMLSEADLFSLNRTEAQDMWGLKTDDEIIGRIRSYGKDCYLRCGTDGAYMVTRDEAAFVPMVSIGDAGEGIDATGCGNTSTGAAMWAYGEGFEPYRIAAYAAVAAGYNALQYGFIPDLSADTRKSAIELAEHVYNQYKK